MKKIKRPLRVFTYLVLTALLSCCTRRNFMSESDIEQLAARYWVEIIRDTFGVPHVLGKTDADACFGLAYAHCEDDFHTIQIGLLSARGRLAELTGKSGAEMDYALGLFGIRQLVLREYNRQLRPDTRKCIEGYAEGINLYAAKHPGDIRIGGLFPVTGMDIVVANTQMIPLFFGLDKTLTNLMKEKKAAMDASPEEKGGDVSAMGSNVFAVGRRRTPDGSTYLLANSHQPWSGPLAWYEAHIKSGQGLDMVGGLFPLNPVLMLGHNQKVGWSFTTSTPDITDVYRLSVNPENKDQYYYDGQWTSFEKSSVKFKVKLLGFLSWPVEKKVLRTVYGPALETETGTYAIRYANFDRIDAVQQLYDMNKAADHAQWIAAVKQQALPCFNIGYADGDGTVYYLYNARFPLRSENFDWRKKLDGTTSKTLWTEYLPFEKLPQVLNPSSGFILNCNSAPYKVTTGKDNPAVSMFSKTLGIETLMSNRALRALELFGNDPSITFDEFLAFKYDTRYSADSDVVKFIGRLIKDETLSSDLEKKGRDLMNRWDFCSDAANRYAALPIMVMVELYLLHGPFHIYHLDAIPVQYVDVVDAYRNALEILMRKFGRLDPKWGEVNRLVRGKVNLPLDGSPDVLRAIVGYPQDDGTLRGIEGDCYILTVKWDKSGKVASYSVHQFGSATMDEKSPHYADQAVLFAERRMKPAWFTEAEIRAHAERSYRP